MANNVPSRTERHAQTKTKKEKQPKKNGQKPKKKRSLFLKILLGIVILGVVALLSGVGLFFYYVKDAPALDDAKLNDTVSSKIFDDQGNVFMDLGAEKREVIQPSEVPQLLKDAVISVEDRRFEQHKGVDPIRIVGSALSNATSDTLQGGSTLTQQLIKLSFFSTKEEDQTLRRKAQEAWMALQLEREKSKEEILTYYINKVYMANGYYGMETAAEKYYGKTLSELNLPQTALLAGMPQAPNAYDPYTEPENAKERRDIVLLTMKDNEKISDADYDAAVATPIDDGLIELDTNTEEQKITDPYLVEVLAEVEEKVNKNPYTDGLEIHTNIDMDAQKKLYDIVNTDEYVTYPDDEMQVASTMIDVNTGQVKAQIGGRHIAEDVQLGKNLAVNNQRDVGSTMKPIADYGPAIEYLNYSTAQPITDEPYKYPGTDISVYNWDLTYMGPITMRTALVESRNVPAVKTFMEVGADKSAEFLKGLDIEFEDLTGSNAISSNGAADGTDYGVTSLKLAAAYAAFANNGIYNKPYYISKVVYQDGQEDVFESEGARAMKESTAYMITDMLKGVISSGTGNNAQIPALYQAGKTGTSNYTDDDLANMQDVPYGLISPDVTFVGYTRNYAVSVWTGYNDKLTPITSEYQRTASDIYREFMSYISEGTENLDWEKPDDVTRIGNELYVKGTYTPPVVSSYSSTSTTTSETSESSTTTGSSSESSSSSTESSSSVESSSSEPEPSETSSSSAPPVEESTAQSSAGT